MNILYLMYYQFKYNYDKIIPQYIIGNNLNNSKRVIPLNNMLKTYYPANRFWFINYDINII
jgi:hypothetical protein